MLWSKDRSLEAKAHETREVFGRCDGFIADPDGGYDWIIMDEAIDFAAIFSEFDTFVMGRKTWDVSAPTEFGDMFGDKEVIVFSRTLKSARPGVTIVNTSPVDTVEIAIMPVLLSQGVPLITPGARIIGMRLDKCETLPKSGIVMLSYTIART